MDLFTVQNEWQGGRVESIHVHHVVHSKPEPGYPNGMMGKGMAAAWQWVGRDARAGMLWLDCDVAADPDDLAAMTEAVEAIPADLHTGMVKLWPASTGRDTWIWSHRPGRLGAPVVTQDDQCAPIYVSTCFLWIPARLLDSITQQLPGWGWQGFDVQLSEAALHLGIEAHTVPACRPKHLHF